MATETSSSGKVRPRKARSAVTTESARACGGSAAPPDPRLDADVAELFAGGVARLGQAVGVKDEKLARIESSPLDGPGQPWPDPQRIRPLADPLPDATVDPSAKGRRVPRDRAGKCRPEKSR
jgi:hypothetical protein